VGLALRAAISVAVLVVVSLSPRAAHADDQQEARQLFERALTELEAGNAAEGRDLLRRSNELYPTIPTRVNLAIALRRTGEAPEAVSMLEALLEDEGSSMGAADRARIEEQLALARGALATLRIRVQGARGTVEVDGMPAGEADDGEELIVSVGAGDHVVVAENATGEVRSEVLVAAGETSSVVLALGAMRGPAPGTETVQDDEGGVSPWVWVGIALGVLAVGAAVTAILLTTTAEDYDGRFETLSVAF
jgi:hypothetical protein